MLLIPHRRRPPARLSQPQRARARYYRACALQSPTPQAAAACYALAAICRTAS